MTKINGGDIGIGAPGRTETENLQKVGKVEYFEKFSGMGRILQDDITTIPFHSRRTTYPVKEGDLVNYRLEKGPSGWQAVDITKKP